MNHDVVLGYRIKKMSMASVGLSESAWYIICIT